MKLKVIFLKKKHMYITIGVIILILLSIFFITSNTKKKSLSTFNIMSKDKIFKTDLTGDGEDDLLYVKTKDNKYYIQVNTKDNKTLFLEPKEDLKSLGVYSDIWPMRLTLKDINRDNAPEIFIQSSTGNKAIQHIFIWDKSNFKDIFCSNNNLLGFIDYSNSKTPKFISGNFINGEISLNNYILVGKDLRRFNQTHNVDYLGKDTISLFINSLSNETAKDEPSNDYLKDICFDNSLPAIEKVLSQLNTKAYKLQFQDGFFKDSKYNNKGEVSEINWILNFKGEEKNSNKLKNYSLSLYLNPNKVKDNEPCFKISILNISPLK